MDYAYNCPATKSEKDVKAAARANEFWAGWYFEPVVLGHYPRQASKWFDSKGILPKITDEDMKLIAEPIDFIGINHYFTNYVAADETNDREGTRPVYPEVHQTDMSWPVTEDGFYELLKYLQSVLKVPLYITENGISLNDIVSVDGTVEDYDRIDYMKRYLSKLSQAISEGLDCRGYYYWSLMDNMEWAAGYKPRFGLIYVDYRTQRRIIKRSGEWYRTVIDEKNNGYKA